MSQALFTICHLNLKLQIFNLLCLRSVTATSLQDSNISLVMATLGGKLRSQPKQQIESHVIFFPREQESCNDVTIPATASNQVFLPPKHGHTSDLVLAPALPRKRSHFHRTCTITDQIRTILSFKNINPLVYEISSTATWCCIHPWHTDTAPMNSLPSGCA